MEKIVWEVKNGLISNKLLWLQGALVTLTASSFVGILLISLNLFEYQWQYIPKSFQIWIFLAVGMFVFFLIVFLLISKGITTRYTVSDEAVKQETITSFGKFMKIFAFLAFVFGGRGGIRFAGATALAASREVVSAKWKEILSARYFPKSYEIRLKNSFKTVIQVICNENNYQKVEKIVKNKVSVFRETGKEESAFCKVMQTFFVFLFGVLLFPRMPVHLVGVFAVSIMLFGLIAVWNKTKFRKIAGVVIIVLLIAGIFLAYQNGEVNFSTKGSEYAFVIEMMSFLYFLVLSFRVLLKKQS